MGFFGSLFKGQNDTLSSDINKTGSISDFASSQGTSNTAAGSNWMQSVLSGDQSKISQSLAPAISSAQKSAQQSKNSTSQFGNRGGGTNASTQGTDAATRGNVTNMVGGMQSGAASSLMESGNSLLKTALGGYSEQTQMSQQQMKNWGHSIFGQMTGQATGTL